MNCKVADLRCKEVINVRDGARLGYIMDVLVDTECGRVVAVTVPGGGFSLFGGDEYVVPWESICRIGDDIVLVDFDFKPKPPKEKKRLF